MKSVPRLLVLLVILGAPAVAQAHGDPASDYLLVRSFFLPFDAKLDKSVVKQLSSVVRAAEKSKFRIRLAIIRTRYDLGTAFSLFDKPQRYARVLGLELSSDYSDRLLVVMPSGYGYAVGGDPDPKASRVLKDLPPPGPNATKEVEAATVAVQRLAAAAGYRITATGGGGSESRDRITIAAAATAGIALMAAFALYRRRRRTL